MTGWDTSSRPTWDPQGETGDSTQAFSAPDFPEDAGDRWPEPDASPSGRGTGRHAAPDGLQADRRLSRYRSGDIPRQPPGEPPDIFRDDYGQQDHGQQGFGQQDFGQQDFGQDRGPRAQAEPGYDWTANGRGSYGTPGPAQEDYPRQDYTRQHARPDFARQDSAQPDFTQQDFGQQGYAGRDHMSRDDAGRNEVDRDYAARMDPALQDFFAPQPSGPDLSRPGQPGYGQQGYGGRDDSGQGIGRPGTGPQRMPGGTGAQRMPGGTGAQRMPTGPQRMPGGTGAQRMPGGTGPQRMPTGPQRMPAGTGPQRIPGGTGPQRMPGQPRYPGQPRQPGPPAQADRWDTGPRPGSRSARRQGSRPPRRGLTIAAIAIALVVVVIIAVVVLTQGNPGTPAASNTLPASMAPTQKASTAAGAKNPGMTGQPAAKPAGYLLTTPATAAGYAKLAAAPATVQNVAAVTAQAVRGQAVNSGGKVTSQLTAYYQLSGGQVMSFVGYQGTFDPAKVLASLANLGSGGQSFPAGPHGGQLACIPSAGTPGGTVCVWVTTTTLGVTEFFGSSGPEVVSKQSKAAEDTVNFRADVEKAKS